MREANTSATTCVAAMIAALVATGTVCTDAAKAAGAAQSGYTVTRGSLSIEFDHRALDTLDWRFIPAGEFQGVSSDDQFTCPVDALSTLRIGVIEDRFDGVIGATLQTRGAVLLDTAGALVPIGYLAAEVDADGIWQVTSSLHKGTDEPVPFELFTVAVEFRPESHELRLAGELTLTDSWAQLLDMPEASGTVIGRLLVDAQLELKEIPGGDDEPLEPTKRATLPRNPIGSSGPDLLIADLQSVWRWSPRVGDITAYSIGDAVCNVGDEGLNWMGNSPDHPVFAQNIYRLKEGRFEHIGMSWVRHGQFPGNGTICTALPRCPFDPTGRQLNPECSDIHTSELNGGQLAMGPRSQVNAATGVIVWPVSAPDVQLEIDRRVQVHDADLDPDLNAGALYYIEGHFIAADDAAAGNDLNNASHRSANVTETSPNIFQIAPTGRTRREDPAILAWQNIDSAVNIEYVDVPDDGRFILACSVTALGDGTWHYEYALHNFSSDRSGQRFSVPVPPGVTISNIGFHDVDYHSGSPYSLTDWNATNEEGTITWTTDEYDEQDPYANALRWGTLYNFRFDADTCSTTGSVELGLYKPGEPSSMPLAADVPGPTIMLLQSDPPDGAIDARQPHEIDLANPTGWQTVDLTFTACAPEITPSQFAVTQQGPGSAPNVERVDPVDDTTIKVVLTDRISVGAWTTITHTPSGTDTTLGYQPADVDGDGTSSTRDLIALIDEVSDERGLLPVFSADIDRSEEVDLGDIVRLIDLLTGARYYDPYMSATLPVIEEP
ncbi:MAG: hypothetical protein ACYTFA_03785 [Planctomycetota bacterium]|jgi:hypothetical protein